LSVTRREFIGGLTATGVASTIQFDQSIKPDLIKPKKISPGDTIGIIAPASPVFERQALLKAQKHWEALGFNVRFAPHISDHLRYLAGSDQDRACDVMSLFTDHSIDAIIALRGGYGSIRLLPYLDFNLIRENPKILMGYSDITTLLLAIHRMTGLVTFHGPVGLSTYNEYSTRFIMETLTRCKPVSNLPPPEETFPMLANTRKFSQSVQAPLTGGNLSLIVATLGTPYEIETNDHILFIEEVGEEPYRIDRMLTQLAQSGKFENIRGIIFDQCAGCGPSDYKPAFDNTFSVEEVIRDRLAELECPVLINASIGHVADKPILPLGIRAELDPNSLTYSLIEPAVCE
jgi:muramoyltetrapeptide carboxypeptidase